MELKEIDLHFLQAYIKKACGLVLPNHKDYIFKFRLEPICEKYNLKDYSELCEQLKSGKQEIAEQVITELTTHETFFFRDNHPFQTFSTKILPELENTINERKAKKHVRKGPKVSIWSAAASTGQEPYSIAMLISEYAKSHNVEKEDFSILATDISTETLSQAMIGQYSDFEIKRGEKTEKDHEKRLKYFKRVGDSLQVIDEIKEMIQFSRCNLTESIEHMGSFDIILARNVLIYFDEETKNKIIDQFHHMLSPGGYLILGASESLNYHKAGFQPKYYQETLLYHK